MEGTSDFSEKLIQAGMQELEKNGLRGFSMRRIAQNCGVSCAAPYKHFKDKNALIQAIVKQYNALWETRQIQVIQTYANDLTMQLREICMEYLRFLLDYPHFCMLATQTDAATSKWHLRHLLDQSSPIKKLVHTYCQTHDMSPETAHIKISLLRAQLFGIATMVGTNELQLTEDNINALYKEMNAVFLC